MNIFYRLRVFCLYDNDDFIVCLFDITIKREAISLRPSDTNTALALGRVFGESDRLCCLFGAVDLGHDNAAGTAIEGFFIAISSRLWTRTWQGRGGLYVIAV